MADYNQGYDQQTGGYAGEERKPVSTYNAHQDEFGHKEGNDYPTSGGYGEMSENVPPQHKLHNPDQPLPKPTDGGDYRGQGYGDQGYGNQGYGKQGGDTYQDTPEQMTGYGDTDTGVGGPKSAYGASSEGGTYDRPTSDQSQFGLEGKTGAYGTQGSDPQLGATDTSSYGADNPTESNYDQTPASATESMPAGAGFGPEDTSTTHGAKKEGLMTKIKQKLPGHHGETDETTDAAPKKGLMTKVKEKLPGHHGSTDDM